MNTQAITTAKELADALDAATSQHALTSTRKKQFLY
jgi:hypothetical protein